MHFYFRYLPLKYFTWSFLVLVLLGNTYDIFKILYYTLEISHKTITTMCIGIIVKLSILYCLIQLRGPIKILLSIWGLGFIISSSACLLSYLLYPDLTSFAQLIKGICFLALGSGILYSAYNIEYRDIKN